MILGLMLLSNISLGQGLNNNQLQYDKMHKVICKEVIQTSNYTYLYVNENDSLIWLAVPKTDAQKDEVYYFVGGMEMGPFTIKELNRTFNQLLFLGGITSMPKPDENVTHKAEIKINKQDIKIEPAENCITIQELYSDKEKYAEKEVLIKGQVTKFSDSIMKRNWIHLQDGTNHEDNFDITITTDEYVNIGDVIIIKGKLILNKDFGYGYFYKAIIEDGEIIK